MTARADESLAAWRERLGDFVLRAGGIEFRLRIAEDGLVAEACVAGLLVQSIPIPAGEVRELSGWLAKVLEEDEEWV